MSDESAHWMLIHVSGCCWAKARHAVDLELRHWFEEKRIEMMGASGGSKRRLSDEWTCNNNKKLPSRSRVHAPQIPLIIFFSRLFKKNHNDLFVKSTRDTRALRSAVATSVRKTQQWPSACKDTWRRHGSSDVLNSRKRFALTNLVALRGWPAADWPSPTGHVLAASDEILQQHQRDDCAITSTTHATALMTFDCLGFNFSYVLLSGGFKICSRGVVLR